MKHALLVLPLALLHCAPGSAQDAGKITVEQLREYAREIQGHVEELRGETFSRPVEVRIADKATFVREAQKRIDDILKPGMVEGMNDLGRMLTLLPPDGDLLQITIDMAKDAAGGFYIPASDTFYLMEGISGGLAKSILSHELVHALDDQLYDIDKGMTALLDNSDAGYAYSAVVEGCAMSMESRWTTTYLDLQELDMEEALELSRASMEGMVAQPPFVWVPFLSAYTSGASFLVRSDNAMAGVTQLATTRDVAVAFRSPPLSSEQILHPEKYWDPELRDDPRVIEFDVTSLPRGWSSAYQDTLGELALSLLVRSVTDPIDIDPGNPVAAMSVEYTNAVAAGWGGDRAIVLANEDARYLRLVTVWDTPRDAAEFYGVMSLMQGRLRDGLIAVSKAARGADEKPRAEVSLEYGAGGDEVVLNLAYGIRRSKLKALTAALQHGESER